MPGLLTIITHPVGCCRCHQRTLHDFVGIVADVQVCGEVGAEVIDDSPQDGGVCRGRGSAPDGAGRLLVAERVVG